jgi:hypothetical protein
MRLLCPFCQKAITVPDTEAGKAVRCPECSQQFAAPQLYSPTASSPDLSMTPPPPQAPPPSELFTPSTPYERDRLVPVPPELPQLPAADMELSGYKHLKSIVLDPKWLRWVPPVAVTLAFFLTFFNWDGIYPGGHSAYTQNAWECMYGGFSVDPVAEKAMGEEKDLRERVHMNWWLVPFLLLLIPTLIIAWAGPIVELGKIKLPPGIQDVWQFRPIALGALVVILFLFLLAQWASGFGLQRAVREKAEETYWKQKADATTPEEIKKWEINVGRMIGSYQAHTTSWLRLAVLMHLLGALAAVGEVGVQLRGQKPPPRVGVMW